MHGMSKEEELLAVFSASCFFLADRTFCQLQPFPIFPRNVSNCLLCKWRINESSQNSVLLYPVHRWVAYMSLQISADHVLIFNEFIPNSMLTDWFTCASWTGAAIQLSWSVHNAGTVESHVLSSHHCRTSVEWLKLTGKKPGQSQSQDFSSNLLFVSCFGTWGCSPFIDGKK